MAVQLSGQALHNRCLIMILVTNTRSPWCCPSVLSSSSKSNSFNMVSLLIIAPVFITSCVINPVWRSFGLKRQLLRLNYYCFQNCNTTTNNNNHSHLLFPSFAFLTINMFYPAGLTNCHMLSSLKGSSSSLKINMSQPVCGNGCLQHQVYIN